MTSQKKRFEKWRSKLPSWTGYLVEQVMNSIVPDLRDQGYVWHDDFAGGDPKEVANNEIPLQLRRDGDWPTIQIRFAEKMQPFFTIDCALLPPVCRRPDSREGTTGACKYRLRSGLFSTVEG